MEDRITAYRQPMVTVTGILLGFILNVGNSWASKAFSTHRIKEIIVAIGMVVSSILLTLVLYRILNMNYPKHREREYYQQTLTYFIWGVGLAFAALIIVMIESFFLNSFPKAPNV